MTDSEFLFIQGILYEIQIILQVKEQDLMETVFFIKLVYQLCDVSCIQVYCLQRQEDVNGHGLKIEIIIYNTIVIKNHRIGWGQRGRA